mmetsp:Transcript_130110/g.296683  ORF Transcript_130110/g.296683 Transcript_130110/m.296683 type:complete len:214 (+) Transcript_130110:1745-2386(+)
MGGLANHGTHVPIQPLRRILALHHPVGHVWGRPGAVVGQACRELLEFRSVQGDCRTLKITRRRVARLTAQRVLLPRPGYWNIALHVRPLLQHKRRERRPQQRPGRIGAARAAAVFLGRGQGVPLVGPRGPVTVDTRQPPGRGRPPDLHPLLPLAGAVRRRRPRAPRLAAVAPGLRRSSAVCIPVGHGGHNIGVEGGAVAPPANPQGCVVTHSQ